MPKNLRTSKDIFLNRGFFLGKKTGGKTWLSLKGFGAYPGKWVVCVLLSNNWGGREGNLTKLLRRSIKKGQERKYVEELLVVVVALLTYLS